MHEAPATKFLEDAVAVTREDIARAKDYVLKAGRGSTEDLAVQWLREQDLAIPRKIDGNSPSIKDILTAAAHAISVRLALHQAIWELIASGDLIPAGEVTVWKPVMDHTFMGYSGGLQPKISISFPTNFERMPLANERSIDPDIFLQGVDCKTLHPGILEAIDQALGCFRRGLYMPATAMLAAAAEATWTECGIAVAKKLWFFRVCSG